jgi:hypothetical protein
MRTLAEIQSDFRNAVIHGDTNGIAHELVGGLKPDRRLSVHQRNYETSLVDALLVKFPATGWLIGTALLTCAAKDFIRAHPPKAPCIAEYGDLFPAFLSVCARAERLPYLRDFAELEWYVGQVAIAVDFVPISAEAFSGVAPDALPNFLLKLQPGLRYLKTSWPVDELMKLYLTETAPEQLELASIDIWLELRGARGQFQFNRLNPAEFVFRKCISEGGSIGEAAERSLDNDAGVDPGNVLAALISGGLAIRATPPLDQHHDSF